jgi:hypothetical protein
VAAAERHRQRIRWAAVGAVAAILIVVAAMVVLSLTRSKTATQSSGDAGPSAVAVQHVPVSVLDAVGAGSGVTLPQRLPASTAPVTENGKPIVLYVGAEYCPFCAAQRWPLIVALSRFGSFQNLGGAASSASDAFPNTQTFSFHGAAFTSDYVSFNGVETATSDSAPLDRLTPAQQALFQRFDIQPYTSSPGAIPFLLIGNRFVSVGAAIDPGILTGMTREEIVAALSDPTSPVAKSVDGAANMLTAAICQATGGKPGSVCSDPTITKVAATLPSGG